MAAKAGGARVGAPSQQTLSIRNKHIACLETLLNFNEAVDSKTSWQESWKILIYDNQARLCAPCVCVACVLRVGAGTG